MDIDRQLEAAAALADPLRRALYRHICSVDREVGRDDAAKAVGAARDRVADQLDRLAEAGLLDVSFRRLSGKTGPGAGRPSKLYRRSALQVDLSLPPLRYDIPTDVFAQALADAGVPPAAVDRSARDHGRRLGHQARGTPLLDAVDALGFEPMREGRTITLSNCPFRGMVEQGNALVCRMNLALFRGMLSGLGATGVRAGATPAPPGCCVRLRLPS